MTVEISISYWLLNFKFKFFRIGVRVEGRYVPHYEPRTINTNQRHKAPFLFITACPTYPVK